MKTTSIVSVFCIVLGYGCGAPENSGESQGDIDITETVENTTAEVVAPDGFQLLQATCFSCHSPNPANEINVAPTVSAIKTAYLNRYPQEELFIEGMENFLTNPSAESALMKDAVDLYGLMPQMSLLSDQSNAIAKYLFQHEVASEFWYRDEYPKEQARVLLNRQDMSYVDRGFEYAMATKSLLGKNLKGKINAEGTLAAVNFCNIKASHFTDSMSTVYQATIKRVSDKPRNTDNLANEQELSVINDFKTQLANGQEIIPLTLDEEKDVVGYYPIVTNDMCLKCHGTSNSIEEGTRAKIELLYPQDKATGYATNQLRGIWVVKMKKSLM